MRSGELLMEIKKLKFFDIAMLDKENLEIEIIWKDSDLLEIRTGATNRRYCGITELYTNKTQLLEFANKLKVFPEKTSDIVIFEAGDEMSYAFVSIRFYCTDGLGHTAAQIIMEENVGNDFRPEEKSKVSFELECSIGQIESFSQQLIKLAKNLEGIAKLK